MAAMLPHATLWSERNRGRGRCHKLQGLSES